MKKNMKKVTLGLSILAVAGAIIILPSTTDAYRGDPNVQGPNYSLERHTAMQNAFENHDFEAWKSLMQDMGKVRVVEFTGGTEGAKEIYERLSHAGVGTIIGMHISEEHRKEAKKHHINLVVTGHMASDSIGMNIFMDELVKKGVTVLPCSGFIRVER